MIRTIFLDVAGMQLARPVNFDPSRQSCGWQVGDASIVKAETFVDGSVRLTGLKPGYTSVKLFLSPFNGEPASTALAVVIVGNPLAAEFTVETIAPTPPTPPRAVTTYGYWPSPDAWPGGAPPDIDRIDPRSIML